jgi:hypothetical protein
MTDPVTPFVERTLPNGSPEGNDRAVAERENIGSMIITRIDVTARSRR